MSNYEVYNKLNKADDLTKAYRWANTSMLADTDIIEVTGSWQYRSWYEPNGLVTIFPWSGHLERDVQRAPRIWPGGIGHRVFRNPAKEYIAVPGNDGVTRYYVLPAYRSYNYSNSIEQRRALGLVILPHPDKLYVPAHPITDYHISVSRKQKNDAWVKWKDFFEFVEVMWELMPTNPEHSVQIDVVEKRRNTELQHDDRDTWHPYVQHMRMTYNHKSDLKTYVDELIMERDLPYNVKLVSELTMTHSSHWNWDLINELGIAGRLDDLTEQ